jgi:carbon-monoxide dehydrogenase medium subunit
MAHLRFAFLERPAVTVSCFVRAVEGQVAEARIAVGSVGVCPVRVPRGEALLVGCDAFHVDVARLDAAGRAAADTADPIADGNGSAEYKRDLVRVLVGRCFRAAVAQLPALV